MAEKETAEERAAICVEACKHIPSAALKEGLVWEMQNLLAELRRTDDNKLYLAEGVDFDDYVKRVGHAVFSVYPPGTF